MSVGPIDPSDPDARRRWARENLRDDDASDWDEPEAPWTEATAPDVHPIVWVCLSNAAEHASFLAFTSRMAGRPFDIVDATGLGISTVGGVSPIWSLGLLRRRDCRVRSLREAPSGRTRGSPAASEAWSQLQRENAPLRVVRDGQLVSAPLEHFDPVLTELATPDWELVVRLIGRALHHLNTEVDPPGQGTGSEFLFARVLALGEAGILEVTGSGPGMREFEVRRPAIRSSS